MNVSITPGQRRGAAAALRSLGRTTLPVVAIVGTVADAYGGRPDASPVESLADVPNRVCAWLRRPLVLRVRRDLLDRNVPGRRPRGARVHVLSQLRR